MITGASGLIGTRLTEMLLSNGHVVSHLGRARHEKKVRSFIWDVGRQQLDENALKDIDTIIHLAGAGIADQRWTEKRKQEILDSRILSTRLLYRTLANGNHSVKTVVMASAIGYYGFGHSDGIFTETSKHGNDFLAQVTHQWENEAVKLQAVARLVTMRIGIVLSEKGGALKEMANPVKYFVGAPVGSGNQCLSWIHIDDLCRMFMKAVDDQSLQGVYNAVGPYPVTNRELTKAIGRVLHRPVILPPVPGFLLKLVLGEMADLVLKGSRVSSEKIQAAGFTFQFNTLEEALENLLMS